MRKRSLILALGMALVLGGAVAWRVLRVSDLAEIGAGYAAQQTCACLFISRRTPESCHADMVPLARALVSVEPAADQVTARSMWGLGEPPPLTRRVSAAR